ncbi:MAG: formylglycine-generating enzyme family protein [Thermoguttaceae bacterium]|jgi:formylglycine-generating enzyme required for sulfatase activity
MKTGKVTVILTALAAVAAAAEDRTAKPQATAATTLATPAIGAAKAGPTITLDLGGGITLEAVLIPAGKFLMGRAPTEKDKAMDQRQRAGAYKGEFNPKTIGVLEYPQHEVTISKPFYMGKYEVTNEQYEKVMGISPSRWKDPRNPVEGGSIPHVRGMKKYQGTVVDPSFKTGTLTWDDTQAFCKKVGELTGKTVRLPTEAEWEYAARAGGPPPEFTKEDLDEIAWWNGNSEGKPHSVGQKKPNAWGLYDMFGNVYEWTQNWFEPYTADAVVDPKGPDSPLDVWPSKVIRGGWYGPGRGPGQSLSTIKFCKPGGNKFSRGDIGFRVVVETPKTP